jgi:hypothetical protein
MALYGVAFLCFLGGAFALLIGGGMSFWRVKET